MPLFILENINEQASWALWHIVEETEELQQAVSLSQTEQEEYERIKVVEKKKEWLASRLLLKLLVRSHHIPDPEVIKDSFGKPRLAHSSASISLSHSYPYAAAILNTGKETGIDIEHSREQLLRIRQRFLNPEELTCAGNSLEKLCVYWTAKEAVYKLYGRRGLRLQEQILIHPFPLSESGEIQAMLMANQVKEHYTLHYRRLKELHVCYSL